MCNFHSSMIGTFASLGIPLNSRWRRRKTIKIASHGVAKPEEAHLFMLWPWKDHIPH